MLFYALLGLLYKPTNFNAIEIITHHRFAVLIPAYQHDEVLLQSIILNKKQDYPADKFDLIVIADSLLPKSIDALKEMGVVVFEVNFEESTKAKAINFALDLLPENNYQYCLVLDIDNVMEPQLLSKMNARLQHQALAIQAHRTAKNSDSSFAILDGISEEINNHIFRKAHVVIKLNAALAGSAQAIEFKTYKKLMQQIHSAVEDKELEIALVQEGIKVLYENDALVYDEKVQNAKVFSAQRKRWLASQFFDFKWVFWEGLKQFFTKCNFEALDKVFQRILLPRVLLLGLNFILALMSMFFSQYFDKAFVGVFVFCCIAFLLAIPARYYQVKTLLALLRLPQVFVLMLFALFNSAGASKQFVPTTHKNNSNSLKNNLNKQ